MNSIATLPQARANMKKSSGKPGGKPGTKKWGSYKKNAKAGGKPGAKGGSKRPGGGGDRGPLKRTKIKEDEDANDPKVIKDKRCKVLYSQLSAKKKLDKKERSTQLVELVGLLKGSVVAFGNRHEMSRVVQVAFKFADEAQRSAMLAEVSGSVLAMSKNTYSSFLIGFMLKHSSAEQRTPLLREFRGNIRQLGTHAFGARVLDGVFRWADVNGATATSAAVGSAGMEASLLAEFYGPEFALFAPKAEPARRATHCRAPTAMYNQHELQRLINWSVCAYFSMKIPPEN